MHTLTLDVTKFSSNEIIFRNDLLKRIGRTSCWLVSNVKLGNFPKHDGKDSNSYWWYGDTILKWAGKSRKVVLKRPVAPVQPAEVNEDPRGDFYFNYKAVTNLLSRKLDNEYENGRSVLSPEISYTTKDGKTNVKYELNVKCEFLGVNENPEELRIKALKMFASTLSEAIGE